MFVHLHVHTEYSLLDGAARIKDLILAAREQGMQALAITDHGVMFGVLDFYKEAKKQGVKPILGCEVYVAPRSRFDKAPQLDDSPYHLVLLAENEVGYRNLLKLVSSAYLEGFYYKPRVDKELLRQHSEGLIALSACLAGEVANLILKDQPQKAREKALEYQDIFGSGNYYLELQDHGLEEQRRVNAGIIELSRDTGIPLVATNDLHYVRRSDAKVQDVLLCIQTGKTVTDTARMSFGSDEFYLKDYDEMNLLFGEYPEALANTLRIAERCNIDFSFGGNHLPHFAVPEGYSLDSYLAEQCWARLGNYYKDITPEIKERLEYELGVIFQTGFAGYFLIVADFCAYARTHGVSVGPGRGSAAGSLVAYVLGITSVDPLRYGLLFERFLNPERVSMPDIDIDFDPEGREKVIHYVIDKYGAEKVSQIITFGTMAAKAAVRDVGRAMGVPLGQVDKVAKLIPGELGITIQRALEIAPDLAALYQENSQVKELLDMAMAVEGMPRHSSTHAAGVVIAKEALTSYLPLQKTSDGVVTTQFPMKTVEEIGLLKMDFLGLRNLSIIDETLRLIKANRGITINLNEVPTDDPLTFQLLSSGDTSGVFQLESSGMRAVLKELKPSVFEDIIAVNALYRPGPMEQIPEFIRRKHGAKTSYPHPDLEAILSNTYGIIVYQEQVMQIARNLAGYSLGRADLLRRAMGKKKKEIMDEERRNFVFGLTDDQGQVIIPGAVKLGVNEQVADSIFDLMAKFAEYGFNKGHATAYAVISYQTAWLKANYPLEFAAALLTNAMGSSDKVSFYIEEFRKKGTEILPPDVNESYENFSIAGNGIRFGLAAVKNVGVGVVQAIIKERVAGGNYLSLANFCERVEGKVLNKRVLESLIKSGAFGSLGLNRAQLLMMLEPSLETALIRQKDIAKGQFSIFDFGGSRIAEAQVPVPKIAEFSTKEILAMEKELLGLYLSGHPMREYAQIVGQYTTHDISDLDQVKDGTPVKLAGVITGSRKTVTKRGEVMAYFNLEGLTSGIEVLIFPRAFTKFGGMLQEDIPVLVEGKLANNDEECKLFADSIKLLDDLVARQVKSGTGEQTNQVKAGQAAGNVSKSEQRVDVANQLMKKVYIKLSTTEDQTTTGKLRDVLARFPGKMPVYLYFEQEKKVIETNPELWVEFCQELQQEITKIWGPNCLAIK